jgi:signal recognition particle subunit SRP54
MFDNLSNRLGKVLKDLRGHGRLSEENMADSMREVRMALLEADVALPVVKDFIERVKAKAISQEVTTSLTPGQAVIKIVNDELVRMMGESNVSLNLNAQPPAVILMAGLQGAGKTTTVAKLGRWLKQKEKLKVMTVSCDVYRPAAIEQLKVLSAENELAFFESTPEQAPQDIASAAIKQASAQFMDVLIVDTAGRLHIDDEMMEEIRQLHATINPSDTLFVIDSMIGQDAVHSAQAFDTALPLTGVILTKTDGDARGGAALSVRQVIGKPILFMGTGEKSDELSPFHPERVASRILGMGDMLSLIEEVEEKADKEKAEKLVRKLKKGKSFTLGDFSDQLDQMKDMGGLLDKLPGANQIPEAALNQVNDKEMAKLQAIISSMTLNERKKPAVINGSRKKRIANGSGTKIQDVNRLLKQFNQMQKMMKKMSKKGGMANMMRGLSGNLPPGFRPQ